MQSQLPVIHPVLDYSNVLAQQVAGGEFSYKINLTSLNRQQASFDAISQTAVNNGSCMSNTADTAVLIRSNCLLRGIPGDYSRFSAEADWRRTLVTYNGQEITPFFRLRGDFAALNIDNQPGVANYIATGQSDLARVMPTAGVEYRYPLGRRRAVGHADDRADRAIDRAAERDADRQISQRRRPEPGVRRQQSVQRSTSSPAGTASKAAAAPMWASSTPPRSTGPARST